MDDCGCKGFNDARRLEAALARGATPGHGLPEIEPGMPLPAGTGLDRRAFISRSAGLALSVYGASRLAPQAFDEAIAQAAAPSDPVLVSIFLEGGADHLSILAPTRNSLYTGSWRTNTKYPVNDALKLASTQSASDDSKLQWHPSLAGVKALHDAGKAVVFPSIGYQHDNQSHFTSRHFWQVGAVDMTLNSGWLGRYLDRYGNADNPVQGLSLDPFLAPSLATTRMPVAAVVSPRDYQLNASGVTDQGIVDNMYRTMGELGTPNGGDLYFEQARLVARTTARLREQLAAFTNGDGSSYDATGAASFAMKLTMLADMIKAGMPLRCVALNAVGSFDTHSVQKRSLDGTAGPQGSPGLLALTFDAICAFQQQLEQYGVADRVLIQVWSEFGRRVHDNSDGTDHGAAGFGMLIGTRVKGFNNTSGSGMIGEFPLATVAGLDANGNQKPTVTFPAVYAAILSQWLGADAAAIIPGADALTIPTLIA